MSTRSERLGNLGENLLNALILLGTNFDKFGLDLIRRDKIAHLLGRDLPRLGQVAFVRHDTNDHIASVCVCTVEYFVNPARDALEGVFVRRVENDQCC